MDLAAVDHRVAGRRAAVDADLAAAGLASKLNLASRAILPDMRGSEEEPCRMHISPW